MVNGAFRAFTPSGSANKYARGIWNITVPANTRLCYSLDVFLPAGFYAKTQGQVAVMRWDNFGAHGSQADNGGLFVNSDDKWRVLQGFYTGAQTEVIPAFPVPENQWVNVRVVQDFDSTPSNEVWVNGVQVASSSVSGDNGRGIDRMRVGLVAEHPSNQTNALELLFDNVRLDVP